MGVIGVERDGHVATLWLDNEAKRNAMGAAFFEELPAAVRELDEDGDVRCIVIAARGPSFCAGIDLAALGAEMGGENGVSPALQARRFRARVRVMQDALSSLAACDTPVVAAIQGHCIGGGIDLVTACDIRLCSADAVFSVRETRMAIVADLGTLQRLPALVGHAHATELVLTGRDVDASHALRIGLVTAVHDDVAALHAAARAVADEIAANAPLAVQGAKAVLRAQTHPAVSAGLDYVSLWNAAFIRSEDLVEAVTARLERRVPEYRGR